MYIRKCKLELVIERCEQVYLLVCWSVWDVLRVRWNLIFIGEEWSCGSLFVGVVIVFANNSRLIDNSRELIDDLKYNT